MGDTPVKAYVKAYIKSIPELLKFESGKSMVSRFIQG